VAVAPLLKALVDVDEALAHLRLGAVDAVDVDEHVLHRLRRGRRLGDVALERGARNAEALRRQVAQEGVEQARARHRVRDPLARARLGRVAIGGAGVAQAEDGLQLAELRGLKAARGVEAVAEGRELARGHRLEHVDLRHDRLEDRQHALEGAERA
jgi:hypothetical protein